MSDIELKDALGGIQPGDCIGHWSTSASECIGCAFATKCSEITSRRKSGEAAVGPTEPDSSFNEVESVPPTDPLEYLMKSLEGKFDRVSKTEEGCRAEYFNFPDGKTAVLVVVSAKGTIKILSAKYKKVVESLESCEEVEEIVREVW